jgi:hypothetical protein
MNSGDLLMWGTIIAFVIVLVVFVMAGDEKPKPKNDLNKYWCPKDKDE